MATGQWSPGSGASVEECAAPGGVWRRPRAAAGATILCTFLAASALGTEVPREILATGDLVPSFGRIGTPSVIPYGIDGRNRVLFAGETSTGGTGLFWTDGTTVETLWYRSSVGDPPVRLGTARTNARGRVVAEGFATPDIYQRIDGFYSIGEGGVRPLVEVGDLTPDGEEICALRTFALNDHGAVVFSAYAARAGQCANRSAWSQNLYIAAGGATVPLFRRPTNPDAPDYYLIGIADDDTVLIGLSDGSAVQAIADGAVRTIVSTAASGPNGESFDRIFSDASNARGEVVFHAANAVYRTDGGHLVRVAALRDAVEDGYEVDFIPAGNTSLSDDGVLTFYAQLRHRTNHSVRHRVLVYASPGEPRAIASGVPRGINDDGVVALYQLDGAASVSRWQNGAVERLVEFGDPAPDGGVFASGGLRSAGALAPDGRVMVNAVTGDLTEALLCRDASGVVPLVRTGDPTPEGGAFEALDQSAFTESGVLLLAPQERPPHNLWQRSLYHLTAAGIETVVGPGMRTAAGAAITELTNFPDFGTPVFPEFASNLRGTVLVRARTTAGSQLLRRKPGGALETITLDLGPERPLRIANAGVAGDDSVVATVGVATADPGVEEYAIVRNDGAHTELVAINTDSTLPGGPFLDIELIAVAGDRILIRTYRLNGTHQTLEYTPRGGFTNLFPDRVARTVVDATAGGYDLVEETADGVHRRLLRSPNGELDLLTTYMSFGDPFAQAINDRGNVLVVTDSSALTTQPVSVVLAGPQTIAQCLPPPTAPPPPTRTPSASRTSTPTITPPPTSTPTPDCDAEPAACARLRVGSASGAAGERVTIVVTLDSGPWTIAGVQNDLAIAAAAPIARSESGAPACRVNPDINKPATQFAFRPAACTDTCTHVRAVVIGLDNVAPIPSGATVYECDVVIAADAAAGNYPLVVTEVLASDPSGHLVPIGRSAGSIDVLVRAGPSPRSGSLRDDGGTSGCQVGATTNPRTPWLIWLPALWTLVASARRRLVNALISPSPDVPPGGGRRSVGGTRPSPPGGRHRRAANGDALPAL
jgi:hypothetical protein